MKLTLNTTGRLFIATATLLSLMVSALPIARANTTGDNSGGTTSTPALTTPPPAAPPAPPPVPKFEDGRLVTPIPAVTGRVLYVSPSGNDTTGTGAQATPFRSINKALRTAKAGDRVFLNTGTYTIGSLTLIPSHVSIDGAGQGKAVIVPAEGFTGMMFEARSTGNVDDFGYQVFRNFTIDGKESAYGGFRAWSRTKSLFHRVTFKNFRNVGIELAGKLNEVAYCRFENASGREGDKGQHFAGAIRLNGSYGLLIHDNVFRENLGGGIKGTSSNARAIRVYRNNIELTGTPERPKNTSASIEIWDLKQDSRIYLNRVNAWLSLINQWEEDDKIPAWGNLYVYKNTAVATPGVTNEMSAVEVGLKGAEFYENNFVGFKHRIFWIEGWGGGTKGVKNLRIYRNRMRDCGGQMNLGPHGRSIDNVAYFNNTARNCGGIGVGQKVGNTYTNLFIANNNTMNAGGFLSFWGTATQYQNVVVTRNVLVNVTRGVGGNANPVVTGADPVMTVIEPTLTNTNPPFLSRNNLAGFSFVTHLRDRSAPTPIPLKFSGRGVDIGAFEF